MRSRAPSGPPDPVLHAVDPSMAAPALAAPAAPIACRRVRPWLLQL
jgi:hypothetical protein